MVSWDDEALQVASDSKWRAQYRLLQSWYRETVLGAEPAEYRGKLRGNWFSREWLADHLGANFLNGTIAAYVDARVPEVLADHGTLNEDRLYRNLLSSMPLCFNVFGYLRANPEMAARALSMVLELDIARVESIEVEWAPSLDRNPLGDRTAFDAYVAYRTSEGRRGFLGVETKYTESFSPEEYDSKAYRRWTESAGSGFIAGAADELKKRATNQLWRNALLVVGVRDWPEFDEGYVVVVHCEGDAGLSRAVSKFETQMHDPASLLRMVSYEALASEVGSDPAHAEWADSLRRRYLDLSVVRAATR